MPIIHFSLPLAATLTAATSPSVGTTQPYDATSAALAPTLPALSGQLVGARVAVQKASADTSTNFVTITCAGSDTFDSGATTLTLKASGEIRELQVHSVSGTRKWKVIGGNTPFSAHIPSRTTVGNPVTLPALVGAPLQGQGGSTLDDGAGNPTFNTGTFLGGIVLPAGTYLDVLSRDLARAAKPAASSIENIPRMGPSWSSAALLTSQKVYLMAIALPAGLSVGSIGVIAGSTAAATPLNRWFGLFDNTRAQLAVSGDALTTPWSANACEQLPMAATAASAGASTTITSGSNAVNVNTFAGSGVLNVTSTASFAASGTLGVLTASGTAQVSYTGKTSTTFTGCAVLGSTLTAGAVAGAMATGGAVWQKTTFSTTYSGLYYVGVLVNATTVPTIQGFTAQGAMTGASGPSPTLFGNSADTTVTTPFAFAKTLGAMSTGNAGYCFVGA